MPIPSFGGRLAQKLGAELADGSNAWRNAAELFNVESTFDPCFFPQEIIMCGEYSSC